jgi:hypothetical protein
LRCSPRIGPTRDARARSGANGHDLAPLAGIYEWAGAQGYQAAAEHILIEGVPVQFLPTYTLLVDEAVRAARVLSYGEVPVRVVGRRPRS